MGDVAMPWPVREFSDPITGVRVLQLTEGPEPSAHQYFTRPSWAANGRYLIFCRRRNWHRNLYGASVDGSVAQLTFYEGGLAEPRRLVDHMHRRYFSWEMISGVGGAVIHPTLPVMAYGYGHEVHLLDLDGKTDEVIYRFHSNEGDPPHCNIGPTGFTADGRDLILCSTRPMGHNEPRIDAADQTYSYALRDESRFVSKLWRYDLENRSMTGVFFQSNGENSHSLTCPWDPDLVLWVNYLHNCLYAINRDGTGLRRYLHDPLCLPGHYNWDTANHRLTTLISLPGQNWRTYLASLDLRQGKLKSFPETTQEGGQYHQNASPDGRWVVLDAPHIRIGHGNGLHVLDQETGSLHPLCELNCSWGATDNNGTPVKSEFLHPNPSWSPDGRYVIARSDYGGGVESVQIFLIDMLTWDPK